MVKNIIRDEGFLRIKSTECTKGDLFIAKDLRDTLLANKKYCVGMAANMIGYSKRMIIVSMGLFDQIMINPVILEKHNKYKTEEGCLSLVGVRKTNRYDEIIIEYLDESFKKHTNKYNGFIAQIIQHECDHLDGIII